MCVFLLMHLIWPIDTWRLRLSMALAWCSVITGTCGYELVKKGVKGSNDEKS